MLREWNPSSTPDEHFEKPKLDWLPAKPPRELLSYWITKHRSLRIMRTPEDVIHCDLNEGITRRLMPRNAYEEALKGMGEALNELSETYLVCKWDVNSETQRAFDRERFMFMREVYIREVLRPLEHILAGLVPYRMDGITRSQLE